MISTDAEKKCRKVSFWTLGCKVNQYETNGIIKKFTDRGYTKVDFNNKADIYVINTCTVTSMADKKSRQMIRRAKKLNGDALVVVTRVLFRSVKRRSRKNPRCGYYSRK